MNANRADRFTTQPGQVEMVSPEEAETLRQQSQALRPQTTTGPVDL
jgi:hypothetical protein